MVVSASPLHISLSDGPLISSPAYQVHPTVDFRQVAVHDLPSMHWVPFEPSDPGWLVPENEGGRLEWIDDQDLGELVDVPQANAGPTSTPVTQPVGECP